MGPTIVDGPGIGVLVSSPVGAATGTVVVRGAAASKMICNKIEAEYVARQARKIPIKGMEMRHRASQAISDSQSIANPNSGYQPDSRHVPVVQHGRK